MPCGCILLAKIDVALGAVERSHRDQSAFEQQVWPQLEDVAVLDRPRLALVGVDREHARGGRLQERIPLQAGWEAGAAETGKAGSLELLDDSRRRWKVAQR